MKAIVLLILVFLCACTASNNSVLLHTIQEQPHTHGGDTMTLYPVWHNQVYFTSHTLTGESLFTGHGRIDTRMITFFNNGRECYHLEKVTDTASFGEDSKLWWRAKVKRYDSLTVEYKKWMDSITNKKL